MFQCCIYINTVQHNVREPHYTQLFLRFRLNIFIVMEITMKAIYTNSTTFVIRDQMAKVLEKKVLCSFFLSQLWSAISYLDYLKLPFVH